LPKVVVYRPDGTIVKEGNDPAMLDDPARVDAEGVNAGVMGAIIIAGVAVLLFALMKILGAKPDEPPAPPPSTS
jgi:hypothetical protein